MLITALCIVFGSVWFISYGVHYFDVNPGSLEGSDFGIYRSAGIGVFHSDWIYKNWTRWTFYPMSLFKPITAYILWGCLQMTAYLFLLHRMSEVPWGWLVVLLCVPFYLMHLQCGNISVLLALLATFKWGIIVSIIFKPYFVLFAVVESFKDGIGLWIIGSLIVVILAWPDKRVCNWPIRKGLIRSANLILLVPLWYWFWK